MPQVANCEWVLLFWDRLNASGGFEMVVEVMTRLCWKKLRECGELLHGKMSRREDDDVLRKALQYEVAGWRKRGRLKRT